MKLNAGVAFAERNKDFWSEFVPITGKRKILIEEPERAPTTHLLAIFSVVLNQARSLTPVWLRTPAINLKLLQSYVPTSDLSIVPRFSRTQTFRFKLIAIFKFLIVLMRRDILSFRYDGIKYGDIVYDSYLAERQAATIARIDTYILRLIYKCIRRHEYVLQILKSDSFEAVLVSHRIGIKSGIILRAALRHGYSAYSSAGLHRATLMLSRDPSEAISYEYKPRKADIDDLLSSLSEEDFENVFNSIKNEHVSGKLSADSEFAFSKSKRMYKDKGKFCQDFGLDTEKPIIFIMLHAFTDHPHSHFRWMLFDDYYDWFAQTLSFAKTFDNANWIFKQHPSNKFYPIRDRNIEAMFIQPRSNIVYMDEENQIDTRSIGYIGDLVVTCLGSAGFEIPALFGVPAVVAGDNPYAGLGFTFEPKSRKEYFETLRRIGEMGKLDIGRQKRARATYCFIYSVSTVEVDAVPALTLENHHDKDLDDWYWREVEKLYATKGETIISQIRRYIQMVANPTFRALRRPLIQTNDWK